MPFRKDGRGHFGQYFHDLMTELGYRKRILDDQIRGESGFPPKTCVPDNKREAKRLKRHEAKYVSLMFKVANCTAWNLRDRQAYVLPAKWFSRWEKYMEYDEPNNKHNKERTNGAETAMSPGEINAKQLAMDPKEHFHHHASPDALCNVVLQPYMKENRDFYVVSKELWEYLSKKYSGASLMRYYIPMGFNGMTRLDLRLAKVLLLFIIYPTI